jgi:hypothetical protein
MVVVSKMRPYRMGDSQEFILRNCTQSVGVYIIGNERGNPWDDVVSKVTERVPISGNTAIVTTNN